VGGHLQSHRDGAPERKPPWHAYFQYLLELFEPDLFVADSGDGLNQAELFSATLAHLRKTFSWRSIQLQEMAAFETNDQTLHALSVIPDSEKDTLTLSTPHVDTWLPAAVTAVFGRIFSSQEQMYAAQFGAVAQPRWSSASQALWDAQFDTSLAGSPINATSFHLRPVLVTDGGETNSFDIVFGDSATVLCWYWCRRAIREIDHAVLNNRPPHLAVPNSCYRK
jgi:hypothetical protein